MSDEKEIGSSESPAVVEKPTKAKRPTKHRTKKAAVKVARALPRFDDAPIGTVYPAVEYDDTTKDGQKMAASAEHNATERAIQYGDDSAAPAVVAHTQPGGFVVMSDERDVPIVQPPAKINPEATPAEQIWQQIRDTRINAFGLPNQRIGNYCQYVPIDERDCYLTCNAMAVLPLIEEAFAGRLTFETAHKYVIARRVRR